MKWEHTLSFAQALDAKDPLREYRAQFHFPEKTPLYFVGNSLGLQPKKTKEYILSELDDWARLGVEGHLHGRHPWYPYHEFLTESAAKLAGAKASEVVVMNSLSVNLHLMLTSFYRPGAQRFKIAVEKNVFPSDRYAVLSHLYWHGIAAAEGLVEIDVPGDEIPEWLEENGEEVALVLLGDVNYLTGEAYPLERIAASAKRNGMIFGVDLAHGIGNLDLRLHDWGVDFAVWCSYKYLNGGPGSVGGCFVHETYAKRFDLPRLAGWWGTDKARRFEMSAQFQPMAGAEGWQVSNPPIFQMAALRASFELFDSAGMAALRQKSDGLTAYLEDVIQSLPGKPWEILTPKTRGAHLSMKVNGKEEVERINALGVACDYREPGILRVAPVPLYNSYEDIFKFGEICRSLAKK